MSKSLNIVELIEKNPIARLSNTYQNKLLTKIKVIRISETQLKTLKKMKCYNVDVGKFIRESISEKIKREYSELIPKTKKVYIPF